MIILLSKSIIHDFFHKSLHTVRGDVVDDFCRIQIVRIIDSEHQSKYLMTLNTVSNQQLAISSQQSV
jgi:hypothetical protein